MSLKRILVIMISLAMVAPSVKSQDIESLLEKYTQENGQAYMQPLADVFGASFNSGLFHK